MSVTLFGPRAIRPVLMNDKNTGNKKENEDAMKTRLTCALLMTMMVSPAMAAGDAEAGKAKSMICASCHGVEGISAIPGYPHLKGQDAQYLINALKAYKNKERTGGMAQVMQPMAMMLNDQDMANLAAYYSQLK